MATKISNREWNALNEEYSNQEVALGEVPHVGMWHSIQRELIPGKLDETHLLLLWGENGMPNKEVIDDDQAKALLHLLQTYFNEENK